MEKLIIVTKDGSHTVSIPALNVTYHSHHGAVQESTHVFIKAGLLPLMSHQTPVIHVLDVGLGTGLNALLTVMESEATGKRIHYTAIELYPLELEEVKQLNYCSHLNRNDLQPVFEKIHVGDWGKEITISKYVTLKKLAIDLHEFDPLHDPDFHPYHLVYYDPFAPAAQPDLWTKDVFSKLYNPMAPGGMLVTYCSKSIVRSAMQAAGFKVTKLPGPRGKREMVRAFKI